MGKDVIVLTRTTRYMPNPIHWSKIRRRDHLEVYDWIREGVQAVLDASTPRGVNKELLQATAEEFERKMPVGGVDLWVENIRWWIKITRRDEWILPPTPEGT